MENRRIFLIVLDSYGIGALPDAADFGDEGSNTLKTITASKAYDTPNMKKLGLFNIDGVDWMKKEESPAGALSGKRYDDRTLGDCRSCISKTTSGISEWISRRDFREVPGGNRKRSALQFAIFRNRCHSGLWRGAYENRSFDCLHIRR